MDPFLLLTIGDDFEETVAIALLVIIVACGYKSCPLWVEGH